MFNRSHKSKRTRRNSAAGFSDSRFLCCHLVEIEDVNTPRKITLFNISLEPNSKSDGGKMSLFRGHLFLVLKKNANKSKRGEQLR